MGRGGIIENLLAKSAERVRPLYRGPLTYENDAGETVPILKLPKFPRATGLRPMSLTPPVAEQFVRAARNWNTRMACCALSGLGTRALEHCSSLAREEPGENDTDYDVARRAYLLAFFQAVEIAEILAERDLLETLAEAALAGTTTRKRVKEYRTDKEGNRRQVRDLEEETEHPPDVRVAMWLMERVWPERWALKRQSSIEGTLSVSGPGGGPIEATVTVGDMLESVQAAIERIAAKSLPQAAVDAEYEVSASDGEVVEGE